MLYRLEGCKKNSLAQNWLQGYRKGRRLPKNNAKGRLPMNNFKGKGGGKR
jgi:hypothetical protein